MFVEPLERLGIDYMVTGSVASMAYGEPRATMDVDIVVRLGSEDVRRFLDAFPPKVFYRPPEQVVRQEIARPARGSFNVIHAGSGSKADFYAAGEDLLHAWGLQHRRRVEDGPLRITLAPPEYVIVRKLEYHRAGQSDKHLRDVAAMLATGCRIDHDWLQIQVARMGLEKTWRELQTE